MTARGSMREARYRRSRRFRAVLAAGVVLGVGATATLAAWNDPEHTTATFTSGSFGIEGSVNGVSYVDYTVSGTPATLSFQLPPTSMTPGMTSYALFAVRTLADSVAGALSLTAGTPAGALASHLRYGVRVVPTATCNQTTFSASAEIVVASDSPLSQSGTAPRALSAGGADPLYYCFAVALPSTADNSAQGKTATQTWTFTGATT